MVMIMTGEVDLDMFMSHSGNCSSLSIAITGRSRAITFRRS